MNLSSSLGAALPSVVGLDRIHKARGVLTCFDLTATPFAPTSRKSGEDHEILQGMEGSPR
jgi:type III restriction enzyme